MCEQDGLCHMYCALQFLVGSITMCVHPAAMPSGEVLAAFTGLMTVVCGCMAQNAKKDGACTRPCGHPCVARTCCAVSTGLSIAACANPACLSCTPVGAAYMAGAMGTHAGFCVALEKIKEEERGGTLSNPIVVTEQPTSNYSSTTSS